MPTELQGKSLSFVRPLMRLPHRAKPLCPVCGSTISFVKGLRMANPWRTRCPICKAPLAMSTLAKVFTVAGGLLYGGLAIYMEESKRWVTSDSLLYFALTAPVLAGLSFLLWPRMKFIARKEGSQ